MWDVTILAGGGAGAGSTVQMSSKRIASPDMLMHVVSVSMQEGMDVMWTSF